MKRFRFLIILLFIIPSVWGQKDKLHSNWLHADFKKEHFLTHLQYLFQTSDLVQITDYQNVKTVLFIPQLLHQTILVKMVGVDNKGKHLISHVIQTTTNQQLVNNELTLVETSITSPIIQKHLITIEAGMRLKERWNTIDKANLEEATSYNGERIRYFSYEVEALHYLVNANTKKISLCWGINDQNKMTTIFFPVQETADGKLEIEGGAALDLGSPCPNTCPPPDEEKNDDDNKSSS